ncbi:COG4 transport protein-domain-containing protein [Amanita rubescens]|nr:COG4 transport protein-domain-containing protein [Amanita rubescens]
MGTKRNLRTLTSVAEILSCISEYQFEEDQLSHSLTESLANRQPVLNSIDQLKTLRNGFDIVHQKSQMLDDRVTTTATTAARIGQRVLVIEQEMSRVKEAGEHVMQTVDLKASLHSLQRSIENQDWEAATRHCSRAMSIQQEVLCGPFAGTVVPTAVHHLPPSQELQGSREQLLDIFKHNFRQASRSLDSSSISRFFKLFPAIGWEVEGLEIYSRFIVELVRSRISNGMDNGSPHYQATSFATLLENIAIVINQHQPVVDKYYGKGKMRMVLKYLLSECDQMVENLIKIWEQERNVKFKVSQIALYQGSLALDPRDVDKIISEIAMMVGRWNLFELFIAETLNVDEEGPSDQRIISTPTGEIGRELSSTCSHQLFEQLVAAYYIPLETWYLCCIINKAHRLAISDSTQTTPTTTIPDDVFYVLKVVIKRLLSMGSISRTRQTLEGLREAMDHNYVGVFRKRLDESVGHTSRMDKTEREGRVSLTIILNDLDVSESHLQSLVDDVIGDSTLYRYFDVERQALVKQYLGSFLTLKSRIQSTLRVGLDMLFNQLLRPRLRNLIVEVFKGVSYVLDDETYSTIDNQEYVRKRFVRAWETVVECYKECLMERNYAMVFGMAVEMLPQPLEKMTTSIKFNELGAMRFDRDLRSIISYLSSQVAYGDVREKFSRLQQISILVNLDHQEDVAEFYSSSGIPWKLSLHEAKAVVSLKT